MTIFSILNLSESVTDKSSLMYSSTSSLSSITTTASPVCSGNPVTVSLRANKSFRFLLIFNFSVIEFIAHHRRFVVASSNRDDKHQLADPSSLPNIEASQRRHVKSINQPNQIAGNFKARSYADRDSDQQWKQHSSAQSENRGNPVVVSDDAIESPCGSVHNGYAADEWSEKWIERLQRVRKV